MKKLMRELIGECIIFVMLTIVLSIILVIAFMEPSIESEFVWFLRQPVVLITLGSVYAGYAVFSIIRSEEIRMQLDNEESWTEAE